MPEPAHSAAPAGQMAGPRGPLTAGGVVHVAAGCLLAIVTALLLYSGIAGIVALATHQRRSPDGAALVVIFAVATLTGWGALTAWERRRRPAGQAHGPARSVARVAAGCLLWALAALLAAIGVAGLVNVFTAAGGSGSDRGLGYVFVVAAWCGSGAWALLKSSKKTTPDLRFLPYDAHGGRARVDGLARLPGPAGGPSLADPGPAPEPGLAAARPAVDPQAAYRERCSQFRPARAGVSAGLLAGSVAGLAAVGGPNGRGAGPAPVLLLIVAVIACIYLLLVLADLPNGIDIVAGRFTVGARGVQPAGRLWRRISGPLEAVQSWDVHAAEQAPRAQRRRREGRPAGRNVPLLGDLRLFSRRQYLRLVVEPAAVQARLPAHLMVGYAFVDAARAGAVWDGVILIGTRRPAALTAALERALPGRRQMPGS